MVGLSLYVVPISGFDNHLLPVYRAAAFPGEVVSNLTSKRSLTCHFILDDSGRWGRGGLFTALEARSDQPRKIYEMAGKMKGKRLKYDLRPRYLKSLNPTDTGGVRCLDTSILMCFTLSLDVCILALKVVLQWLL